MSMEFEFEYGVSFLKEGSDVRKEESLSILSTKFVVEFIRYIYIYYVQLRTVAAVVLFEEFVRG